MRLEKQARQRIHVLISSSLPARAFKGSPDREERAGNLNDVGLAGGDDLLHEAGSLSAPTVATAECLTCLLISAAYLTLTPSSKNMLGCVT